MSPTLTRDQKLIMERAAKYRLPAIYEWREQVEGGGLMSYGGSTASCLLRFARHRAAICATFFQENVPGV
jgi:hypothetical protein